MFYTCHQLARSRGVQRSIKLDYILSKIYKPSYQFKDIWPVVVILSGTFRQGFLIVLLAILIFGSLEDDLMFCDLYRFSDRNLISGNGDLMT